MNKIENCINCKERAIVNQKRQLCARCYQRLRKINGPFLKIDHQYSNKNLNEQQHIKREILFIKNFFFHNDWISQPAKFNLTDTTYTPDFYDARRNVFIEVVGSRQAYFLSKKKIYKFKELFPDIILEVRTCDGELLENKTYGNKWTTQYSTEVDKKEYLEKI